MALAMTLTEMTSIQRSNKRTFISPGHQRTLAMFTVSNRDRSVGSMQQNAVTTVSSCCIIHSDKNVATGVATFAQGTGLLLQNVATHLAAIQSVLQHVATQLCKMLQHSPDRYNRTLQNVAT